jgi:hypothetical protein
MQIRVFYVNAYVGKYAYYTYMYTYPITRIIRIRIRMQIRVIYISVYICKYANYTNYTYADTRIMRIRIHMQIRDLYILYVCKYSHHAYPYTYANTQFIHIIRMQIRILYISIYRYGIRRQQPYVCMLSPYTDPYNMRICTRIRIRIIRVFACVYGYM